MTPFRRLFRLFSRAPRDVARDIDDELDTHVALRVDYLRSAGLSVEDAEHEASRRFGDMSAARDTLTTRAQRRARRLQWREIFDAVRYDVLFTMRQLRRTPGAALFAITSLALGIGLATAFFAAVDSVLLRPLPFREAHRLVALSSVDSTGQAVPVVSADDWYDWRRENKTLSGVTLYGLPSRFPLVAEGNAQRASAVEVMPGFFGVIGARILVGRGLEEADVSSGERSMVVSEGFWRRVMGAKDLPASLSAFGNTYSVVGVVASGQEFPAETELWTANKHTQRGGWLRNNINWFAVGRLAPNATIEQATSDLTRIAVGIHNTEPQALYSYGVRVQSLQQSLVGGASQYLLLLMGAVLCVLLITCANLASINLARGTIRAREMSVRAAIGANRTRLIQQLLVEHTFIALIGGVAGALLAVGLLRGIVAFSADQLPRTNTISIDGQVLLFALATTIAVGLVTGLLPALQAGRASLVATMAAVSRGAVRGGSRAGRTLVAFEIAMAVVLVAGAGLLVQSFRTLLAQPLGYETHGVLTADITLSGPKYRGQPERMTAFWRTLLTQLRASPGVADAGLANWIPLGIGPFSFLQIEGREKLVSGGYRVVSDKYFNTLQIPLLSGRTITEEDDTTRPRVGVINRALAEKYWPGENAVGKRLSAPSMEPSAPTQPVDWITVVGVVGNVRHEGPERDVGPELYVAYQQLPRRLGSLTVVVRSTNANAQLAPLLREQLRELDPQVAADIGSMTERFNSRTADRRFTMSILMLFGALALALAAIGVYSILAVQVAQRTRELAVRSALGADRNKLLQLVLRNCSGFVALGVVVGLIASMALSRLMEAFVFGISARDPMVLASSTIVIVLVAFAAAWVPALAATRIDPIAALHAD